jgi:hypothetical protein
VESQQRAYKILSEAIAAGNISSSELVLSQSSFDGCPKELITSAIRSLESAANAGSTVASIVLSREFISGRHLSVNLSKAEALLKSAAATGHAAANFELGVFYCRRNSNPADLVEGLNCYLVAADAQHPIAQYNAAVMLMNGLDGEKDVPRALQLLAEAASQGVAQATVLLHKNELIGV